MISVPQETYYVMPMFDHSPYGGSDLSLDKIATEVYGRKYVGQQTGDMLSNDTHQLYDMTEHYVEELISEPSYIPEEKYRHFSSTCLSLEDWLAEPDGEYDFVHERKGPEPATMLAHLIKDGHLPYGKYLIGVSW